MKNQGLQIDLPTPPTLNTLWRRAGERFYSSPGYVRWKQQADRCFMEQRLKIKTVGGAFTAEIQIDRKRTKADLDNIGTKALFDWAQSRGLIRNDRDCVAYTVRWVSSVDAPLGCRVTLKPA